MSTYHQHIIWESSNGTWGIGFFERIDTNYNNDPEYDSEWDDAYSDNNFVWAKTGFRTPALAVASSSKEFRPGYEEVPLDYATDPSLCEKFDRMAISLRNPKLGEQLEAKETEKLNQLHADKLSEHFLNNNGLRYAEVVVYFKQDEKVYQQTGMSIAEHGRLFKKNDVFMLAGKPVFDLSTGRVAPNVHSIRKY